VLHKGTGRSKQFEEVLATSEDPIPNNYHSRRG
jgi:hypothetical protein